MTASMDPYRVLGLELDASPAEVKRAYRRLAKALHPDAAGERALPAFLELQDAYERLTGTKVRTVRSTTGSPAPAPPGGQPFREPWRADPARARAAREQARTRRPWSGATTGSTGRAQGARGATEAPGAGGAPRPSGPGARRARPEAGSGNARGADAGSAAGAGQQRAEGPRPRRRSSRKATLGSTSYDEARDPADPRWAGASWYGPTTGEYWIVNPREYADPRKHGPGYRSRGRVAGADDAAADALGAAPLDGGAVPEDVAPEATAADERWARETVRPRRPAAEGARAGAWQASAATSQAGAAAGGAADPATRSAAGPSTREQLDAAMRSFLRRDAADPTRRLAFVLLAWPPLGFLAAWLIGSVTGCASYAATCDGTDPFLPWLAQGVILGTILLLPPLARILAAGTLTALAAVLPATAIVIALGGARSAAARPLLGVIVGVAWTIGVAWGLRLWLLALGRRDGAAEGAARDGAARERAPRDGGGAA